MYALPAIDADIDPGDAPTTRMLSERMRRARRDHVCECGKTIPAGSIYYSASGTEDGEFFYIKRCADMCVNDDDAPQEPEQCACGALYVDCCDAICSSPPCQRRT